MSVIYTEEVLESLRGLGYEITDQNPPLRRYVLVRSLYSTAMAFTHLEMIEDLLGVEHVTYSSYDGGVYV